MTVKELIERLKDCRGDAKVLIVSEGCYGENFLVDDSPDNAVLLNCDLQDE